MERRDDWLDDGKSAHDFFYTLTHLRGGLVGKGHRQDGFGHRADSFNQVGDPVGDYARLAATCTGEDQHRAIGGYDGFALLRV